MIRLFLVGFVLILTGCSSHNIQSSAKVLRITQESIIISAKTADRLCDEGILNKSQCTQISKAYEQAKDYYHLAIEAELMFIDASLANQPTDIFLRERDNALLKLYEIAENLKGVINEP